MTNSIHQGCSTVASTTILSNSDSSEEHTSPIYFSTEPISNISIDVVSYNKELSLYRETKHNIVIHCEEDNTCTVVGITNKLGKIVEVSVYELPLIEKLDIPFHSNAEELRKRHNS